MHFDGSLVLAKSCPGKQCEAQIDGGRIQGVETGIQIDADRVVGIKWACHSDQDLSEVGKDPTVAGFVGVSQGGTRNLAAKTEMIELTSH